METEPKGFIFRDSGDLPGFRSGKRIVDATRPEAIGRLFVALSQEGGRYDMARQDAQIAVDHVRSTFTWFTGCE